MFLSPRSSKNKKPIPLCFVPQLDIPIWPKENLSVYSVKSGYKALCDEDSQNLVLPQEAIAQKSSTKNLLEWDIEVESTK